MHLLWYSVDLLHSMGGHIKTWYHRAILVRERKLGASDRQEGALHWRLWGVLGLLSRGRGKNRVQRDIQWFQQDGAPPHTANITLDWLDHKFPNRLISRKHEPEWPPHSRDLNPLDFYLWGFLKNNVYRNNPQIIPELKKAIMQKINAIPKEECIRGINNFASRIQVCRQQNGGHLEHII